MQNNVVYIHGKKEKIQEISNFAVYDKIFRGKRRLVYVRSGVNHEG